MADREREKEMKPKSSGFVSARSPRGAPLLIGGFSFSERTQMKLTVAEIIETNACNCPRPAAECFFSSLFIRERQIRDFD